MRISYDAPFTLTFAFFCLGIFVCAWALSPFGYNTDLQPYPLVQKYFMVGIQMDFSQPLSYLRVFSHVLGHQHAIHLLGNLMLILLLGPVLEEKYGSFNLFMMALTTAVVTGLLNNFLMTNALLGASGIGFMMIVLVAFTNYRAGELPLSLILIVLLYFGQEMIKSSQNDNISQFAHIIGGICGSIFGFAQVDESAEG